MTRIGFIGFGEAAFHMAKGLNEEGHPVKIYCYDVGFDTESPYRKTLVQRVSEVAVTISPSLSNLVAESDIVIISVPARFTDAIADKAREYAKSGQLFVDVTTALPDIKQKQECLFSDKKALYIDSAMLGPLPIYGHKVPMLSSGIGAKKWQDTMLPFNMSIKIVEGKAGEASRIKLVRSVFMKGLEALLVETFLFARKNGVESVVLASIAETINKMPFEKTVQRLITADTIHSRRRSFEVAESITLMKEVGIDPLVASGIKKRLERSAEMETAKELGGIAPESLDEVYRIWEEKMYC